MKSIIEMFRRETVGLVIGCTWEVERKGEERALLSGSGLGNCGAIQYTGKHGRRSWAEMEQVIILYVKF